MTHRIWDPEGEYAFAELKTYAHWTVDVSARQHTLGSFIIFCNRHVERIADLADAELLELKQVMGDMEAALAAVFAPDRVNYWQMGNALHHLHFHGMPRYQDEREFVGRTWRDESWGTIPPWTREEVDEETVGAIRNVLIEQLGLQLK